MKCKTSNQGFTLIELLVVIAIIGTLFGIVSVSLNRAREDARISASAEDQRQLQRAVELYYNDMGFYPPDVGRGWDPGFTKVLPNNPDTGADCAINSSDCPTSCNHCPSNWINIVQAYWSGPYTTWPKKTAWGGKYDYNYWYVNTNRYGCIVPPAIYIGVQGDYSNAYTIPNSSEQKMLDKGLDSDGCVNGESQLLLYKPL